MENFQKVKFKKRIKKKTNFRVPSKPTIYKMLTSANSLMNRPLLTHTAIGTHMQPNHLRLLKQSVSLGVRLKYN